MILIADSGGTKTDWLIASGNDSYKLIKTDGLHPFLITAQKARTIIESQLLPVMEKAGTDIQSVSDIYFYGAGCLPEPAKSIRIVLSEIFDNANIEIETDLTGAARALCQNTAGIACILGTGSNSCIYDGKSITENVPPLGYILGDEGSGAYIGKKFIGDCFKEQFPAYIKNNFLEETKLSMADILDKVYKQPFPNRFLASLTHYIYKHKDDKYISQLLKQCFRDFFERNVMNYKFHNLKVHFTGSVSWYFKDEIMEVASELGIETGKFVREPIIQLLKYHIYERHA